jgi:HAD superfamily hydrolase (TIGR01509 family)
MDGVIFDTESLWKSAFNAANDKFNLTLTEEYRQSTCGKNETLIRQELSLLYPSLDVPSYREFMLKFVNHAIDNGNFAIKDDFLSTINYIRSKGLKTALATSSHKSRAEKLFKLKGLDIDTLFDYKVFSEDTGGRSKPDPHIFALAAQGIGVPPQNCIVLEDSITGIMGAVNGNFIPIMVIDLIAPNDYCIKNCKKIIRSLRELCSLI